VNPQVLVNGKPDARIDPRDRGLHYGDGLFETLAVVRGEARLWDLHLDRLLTGCQALRLPEPDGRLLAREAKTLCTGSDRGVLKIVLTRGPANRGYRIARTDGPQPEATRILILSPAEPYSPIHYRTGVAVRVCATRLGLNPALAGLKHLNRLEQVLARDEWSDPAIAEGLMLDANGHVIEGTMSNVFAVADGRLCTPRLDNAGVAGVMRQWILNRARELGIETAELTMTIETLEQSDEVFLCNSLIGIWPVARIADAAVEVGPVTRRLMVEVAPHCLMP